MTSTPSPVPPRRSPRALFAALVALLTMGLVVLSGVVADAAPHGVPTPAAASALSEPVLGPGVAAESRRDPASLRAGAVALDADDLTETRSRTALPVPDAIVAAPPPVRAAADLSRPDLLVPERPPRA